MVMTDKIARANVLRNMGAEWLAWYESLPAYQDGMAVRCPTKNSDGTPADASCGCGSTRVVWAGDVYDCCACGIFFCDWAADPPHHRHDSDR